LEVAKKTGAKLTLSENPKQSVQGVDFIYTDVWVSMGEPTERWAERISLLLPYQVNAELLKATGHPHTKVMHCLPALHDASTAIGRDVAQHYGLQNGIEITDEVFEANADIIFQQAENRLHTIKAILVATLSKPTLI
jgi:ornithine carbamoyltransferase